jgi:hypothetical protein
MSDSDARWIDVALGESAGPQTGIDEPSTEDETRTLEAYRRVVDAVRSTDRSMGAPDRVLKDLLGHQRAMMSVTASTAPVSVPTSWLASGRSWKALRLAPLSAAFALGLAFLTAGLPTLLDPPPETFTVLTGATHVPSAPLRGGFNAAAPEFSADPSQDELDTTLVITSGVPVRR